MSPALRARQAVELRRRLARHVDGELQLSITDNRSVMLSVRRSPRHRRFVVRLHHLFVDAPGEILAALASYVTSNNAEASRRLNDYIDENDHRIRPRRGAVRRGTVLRQQGRVYDLHAIFHDLNQRYFDGEIEARITWGRQTRTRHPRRSVRLGSYTVEERLIRIHPGLDQAWVPFHYLQWVVYHEMLHARHPIPRVNGRRRFHTAAFVADERRFEHYQQVTAWERSNLPALLSI